MSRGSKARPLLVPVAVLLRRPGQRQVLRKVAHLDQLGLTDVYVAAGADIQLDLVLESQSDELTVTGRLRAPFQGSCRRCLERMEAEMVVDVQEIFERRPVEGETYRLDGEVIDLEPMVREAILLDLPLAPLCREDCPGPAPERYPTAVEGDETPPDPRWAALRDLRLDG